jgi:hypothetical protein
MCIHSLSWHNTISVFICSNCELVRDRLCASVVAVETWPFLYFSNCELVRDRLCASLVSVERLRFLLISKLFFIYRLDDKKEDKAYFTNKKKKAWSW